MKKVMIVQPMAGLTEEQIKENRSRAVNELVEMGYTVVNSLFADEWYDSDRMTARGVVQIPVMFLAKSLEVMSQCHAIYLCHGWDKARGCKLEYRVAQSYGIDMIYEGVAHGRK